MALLTYLIPLFFITFAFGELGRISFIPAASVGLVDVLALFIVGIWLFKVKKGEYFLKNAILAFIIMASLSLLLNFLRYSDTELFISALYIVRFVLFASLYFVFKDVGLIFRQKIPKFMFLTGLIFILVGFLQYFIIPGLKKYYYLGWDMHQDRIFSSFIDPNFAGAFLVMVFVFVIGLRDKIFPKKYSWIFYLFSILNFLAIVLTYSRGAYLMLLVCAIAYSFLTKSWKITLCLIISFAIVFLVLSPKFGLESTNLLRFASVEARIGSSETAIRIWRENPLGVGFNAYRYAREQYGDHDIQRYGPSHAGAGVDNSFIFVLVTAGIIGLIAYIYLLFRILRLGYLNMKKK